MQYALLDRRDAIVGALVFPEAHGLRTHQAVS
jgi:hypothetical protein